MTKAKKKPKPNGPLRYSHCPYCWAKRGSGGYQEHHPMCEWIKENSRATGTVRTWLAHDHGMQEYDKVFGETVEDDYSEESDAEVD